MTAISDTGFNIVTRHETLCGERGVSYAIYRGNAEVASGWTRGGHVEAMAEARVVIQRMAVKGEN